MRRKRRPQRHPYALAAAAVGVIVVIWLLLPITSPILMPVNPLIRQLAPGAAPAIARALGSNGLNRLTQVLSYQNKITWYSAGTHRQSGTRDGQPYGNAFDIAVVPWRNPDRDVRLLRLQGIAAWRRGPGAPGGAPGLAPHIHCVWPGAPSSNPQNAQQIASFLHGWRGLANRGRPRIEWRDPTIRRDEIGCVRRVYERCHGRDSAAGLTAYDALHRGADGG